MSLSVINIKCTVSGILVGILEALTWTLRMPISMYVALRTLGKCPGITSAEPHIMCVFDDTQQETLTPKP